MNGGISRATNKLSDRTIRAWISKASSGKADKAKLADGGGLYLTLTPAGTACWRIKYRHDGKEKLYAVGTFHDIGLEAARAEREAVKAHLRNGTDPLAARRVERATNEAAAGDVFEQIAAVWLAKKKGEWSGIHYEKSSRAFERDVLPRIGKLPVREITPAMVAAIVEAIVKRGARETASKVLQHIGGAFRLAQARGLRDDNPADAAHEELPRKTSEEKLRRMPALLTFPELGALLRSAEVARLSPAVRMAHRLYAFAPGARTSNIVAAEWEQFDLESDTPSWTIPRASMKARDRHHDHRIMLCPEIVAELKNWRRVSDSKRYAFPSPQGGKHITREALEKCYRVTLNLADKHAPHGWRSAFSTLARDNDFEREIVELTLDHIHDSDVARAYDRGGRLKQRIEVMNWWGKQLAQAERGGDVVAIKRA